MTQLIMPVNKNICSCGQLKLKYKEANELDWPFLMIIVGDERKQIN